MNKKVKSLADLKKIKADVQQKMKLREQGEHAGQIVQIKVAMATCGIASGAKEVMEFIIEELDFKGIDAVVTQTGCMGYCYAEPTIEVIIPGQEPVIYGFVTMDKAREIIEEHIVKGEMVDGIIPVTFKTIDDEN
ncbi:MAG: (2Fe-2S) ferredoxin domain-containing protein [Prolixibacteraceae bacterium]|nr:(2Fe-2S) ferredoxin domain-containing protein [Prolixibacteraceae bacterium]MBN2649862.1 (2Fe-2S) ferredoxin domain-containing protein [Prolixibacteraceae bacterium]